MNRRQFLMGAAATFLAKDMVGAADAGMTGREGARDVHPPVMPTGPGRPGDILTADTLHVLRKSRGGHDAQVAVLKGYHQVGDHGNGLFFWDPISEADDNGGTVIMPHEGSRGRWRRLHDGELHAAWFGVSAARSGAENVKALNRAIESCAEGESVVLTERRVEIAGTISGKQGVTLRGRYYNGQQLDKVGSDLIYTGPEGSDFIRLSGRYDGLGMTFLGINVDGRRCSNVFNMVTVRGRWLDCVVRGGDVGVHIGSAKDSEWNGEHRIAGCSIEGQRSYGVQVEGRAAYDGFILSNVIYNYGRCGICFGSSSQVAGWLMAENHIYPGSVKSVPNGGPKRTIEIHANATNFTITDNFLEGGILYKCTNREGTPSQITNNRITLVNDEKQVGIEIEVESLKKGRVLITNNIISMHPGKRGSVGKGIRITKGLKADVEGKVAFNMIGEAISKKYDVDRNERLTVLE